MAKIVKKNLESGIGTLVKSILFMLAFMAPLIVSGIIRNMFPEVYNMLIYGVLGTCGGLLIAWIFLKAENNSFASIGLIWERKTLLRFVFGFLIGSVIFALILSALLYFSELTIQYHPDAFNLQFLFIYLPILPLALMEEIGFRSYPQIRIKDAYGIWVSQFVIAIAFGSYHILNGWSVYSSFTGPFVWAFVFGLAALWSRGIAMPTGIHFALNVLQNIVGLKGNKGAIWKLDYLTGTPKELIEQTAKIGLLLHATVLVGALIFTVWYAKRMKGV
jgi:membrane protease YdiL (CAAX protease family)